MSFLTPLAALVALAAFVPLIATAYGRIWAATVARRLGLEPPPHWSPGARTWLAAAAVALLGLAAAQPVLSETTTARTRSDVGVLFVLDTSRSMAASLTSASPTRLARAVRAAVQLRAAIPEVPAGVATLTDRVLPDLLPVPDIAGFDAVVTRGVKVEDPPPVTQAAVATSYAALGNIATGNYFDRRVKRRVIVLLTDGESNPFDPGRIARLLGPQQDGGFLAIRFWNSNESVFDADGQREPGYHPDPTGGVLLSELAAALGGRSFEENETGAAASYLRQVVGHGAIRAVRRTAGRRVLAPYVAALAIAFILISVTRPSMMRRCIVRLRRWRDDALAVKR